MDDTLGTALGDVSRLMRRRFDERARAIGVTRAQWLTLKVLSRNEGINQGRLAEMLEVEPITCARMLDRLAEAGMVERRPDPADRRAWRIHLTEKARPLLEKLRVIGVGLLDEAFEGISEAKQAEMLELLLTIRTNLTHATPEFQDAANG